MHVLQVIFQYTSITNNILVHLNGMNKMEDFSHDEGICIIVSSIICKASQHHTKHTFFLMWYHFEMNFIQSLNKMACLH